MDVKVGDRVSTKSNYSFDPTLGTVKSVDGNYCEVAIDDGETWPYYANELEPVAVADSNGNVEHVNQPKFKVGDRVRLVKDGLSTTGAVGKLATIDSWSGVLQSAGGEYLLKIDPPVDYKTLAVTKEYTRAAADCFELVDAPLAIREGKFYRTRDGRKVGPMRNAKYSEAWEDVYGNKGAFVAEDVQSGRYGGIYASDGTWLTANEDCNRHNLVAEWPGEPAAADDSSNGTIDDWYYDSASDTTGFTVPLCSPEFGGAESKFKVGDKVSKEIWNNKPYEVTRVEGESVYLSDGNGLSWPYSIDDDELRLVAEATTAQEPPTSIADIVRRLERLEEAREDESDRAEAAYLFRSDFDALVLDSIKRLRRRNAIAA